MSWDPQSEFQHSPQLPIPDHTKLLSLQVFPFTYPDPCTVAWLKEEWMKFWISVEIPGKILKTAVAFLDRSVDQIQSESHQLVTFSLEVQSEKNEDKNHGGGRG